MGVGLRWGRLIGEIGYPLNCLNSDDVYEFRLKKGHKKRGRWEGVGMRVDMIGMKVARMDKWVWVCEKWLGGKNGRVMFLGDNGRKDVKTGVDRGRGTG